MTICALKSCGTEVEADSDNHVDIHAKFSSKNASNLQKMKVSTFLLSILHYNISIFIFMSNSFISVFN